MDRRRNGVNTPQLFDLWIGAKISLRLAKKAKRLIDIIRLGKQPGVRQHLVAHPSNVRNVQSQRRCDETVTSVTLTRPGSVVGTLAYLSPEQARGEEVDLRSDIYSLGVVLYQMATGHPPFRGETSGELIGAILRETPVKPSALNPRVPGGLERIILKSLVKDRGTRYQSTGELLADLKAIASAGKKKRVRIAAAAAAALFLAGG